MRTLDKSWRPPFGRLGRVATLGGLALSLSLAAKAQAEVVTLASLEEAALKERPRLAADAARVRAARASVDQAKSAQRPRFTLRGDATLGPGRRLLPLPGDEDYLVQASPSFAAKGAAFTPQLQSGAQLSADSRLYDFGRTRAAIEASEENTQAARAAQAASEEQIRESVRASYLYWLLQHELVRLSEDALEQVRGQRQRADALIERGVRPEGDRTRAESEEVLAQLDVERAKSDLADAKLSLEQAMGSRLSSTSEPDLSLLDASPVEAAGSEPDAAENALSHRYEAAKAAAEVEARANRPDLSASVTAGVRTQLDTNKASDNRLSTFPLYGAGLAVTIPLWDGGLSRSKQAQALAEAQALGADLAELRRARSLHAQKEATELKRNQRRLELAESLLRLSEKRLSELERGYDLGASTMQQLIEARSLVRRAQAEILAARVARAGLLL